MTVARHGLDAEASPSGQSLRALDAVNFFVGGALAGFGSSPITFTSPSSKAHQKSLVHHAA